MNIHIITDSASDIVDNTRADLTVIPMLISFDEEEFLDGATLSHQEFYERLIESNTLPVTSQITPYRFEEAIEPHIEEGSAVIIITMSGKLSGTYQSALAAARKFPGKAFAVDSENVSIAERILVEYALRLADEGRQASEIAEELNRVKGRVRIIALLDTLEYLKKGGRISKTAAVAGDILSIKPVVGVKDGEVVLLGKARGSKRGNNLIAEYLHAHEPDLSMPYCLGYTGLSDLLMQKYIKDNAALWQGRADSLPVHTIGGTIGTHVGPGAIAVAWIAKEESSSAHSPAASRNA